MIARRAPQIAVALAVAAFLAPRLAGQGREQQPLPDQGIRFSSGVEIINVNATVYDDNGHFVEGLTRDDFIVYEDDARQEITQFTAERVPVSLGIVLDTSGSMSGEKIHAAESALNRFLYDLLDAGDEIFLSAFSDRVQLLQGWTSDRRILSEALARMSTGGGTALYDAVAQAVPVAAEGQHQKKALVVISDGNDTSSRTTVADLREQIRQSNILVYAIGIDAERRGEAPRSQPPRRGPVGRPPSPVPFPFPPAGRFPGTPPQVPEPAGGWKPTSVDERVNVAALRDITDDSGGRTEIIREAQDLNPATAGIADELRRQYYLGYATATGKDGKWHSIRVETRNPAYHVRARRGFIAN